MIRKIAQPTSTAILLVGGDGDGGAGRCILICIVLRIFYGNKNAEREMQSKGR